MVHELYTKLANLRELADTVSGAKMSIAVRVASALGHPPSPNCPHQRWSGSFVPAAVRVLFAARQASAPSEACRPNLISHKCTVLIDKYSNIVVESRAWIAREWLCPMRDSFEMALAIFRAHDGLLRTGQAKRLGIDPKTISEMTDAGLLDKLGRGLYRLAELPRLDYPDLVQVSLRVPKAVICLISALAFHQLTTQVPHRVHIALPQSVHRPRLKTPPLAVVWLSEDSYAYAIEFHRLDGVDVPIYGKEKTVTDCFKFRNRIGLDVAIEALKDYVEQGGVDLQTLLDCARVDRVENVIEPYLEAIVA